MNRSLLKLGFSVFVAAAFPIAGEVKKYMKKRAKARAKEAQENALDPSLYSEETLAYILLRKREQREDEQRFAEQQQWARAFVSDFINASSSGPKAVK